MLQQLHEELHTIQPHLYLTNVYYIYIKKTKPRNSVMKRIHIPTTPLNNEHQLGDYINLVHNYLHINTTKMTRKKLQMLLCMGYHKAVLPHKPKF